MTNVHLSIHAAQCEDFIHSGSHSHILPRDYVTVSVHYTIEDSRSPEFLEYLQVSAPTVLSVTKKLQNFLCYLASAESKNLTLLMQDSRRHQGSPEQADRHQRQRLWLVREVLQPLSSLQTTPGHARLRGSDRRGEWCIEQIERRTRRAPMAARG